MAVSVVVCGRNLRGLLDSGAGDSVVDIGTLEVLGIENTIVKDNDINLWDASNRKMDFLGRCTVTFDIPKLQQRLTHEFAVLNVRTYKTFLLGRDFFKKTGPVTFDICKNRIKMCGRWITGDVPKKQLHVRI